MHFHQPPTVHFLWDTSSTVVAFRMDEGKVEAISSWPLPTTIKELQTVSLQISPILPRVPSKLQHHHQSLTDLLKGKAKSPSEEPLCHRSYEQTLRRLSPAHHSLVHPNSELSFVVEVDASTTGVGAVLSQQQGRLPDSIPCAFFSRKLSPAERIRTSAIENFLPSSWPSKNGGTGWKDLHSLSSCSPTTKNLQYPP